MHDAYGKNQNRAAVANRRGIPFPRRTALVLGFLALTGCATTCSVEWESADAPRDIRIALIRNTFVQFNMASALDEGIFVERGGCKTPLRKYQAVFSIPIEQVAESYLKTLATDVDVLQASAYEPRRDAYDVAIRLLLVEVENDTLDAREAAHMILRVRVDVRTATGEAIFNEVVEGRGRSKPEDVAKPLLDQAFDAVEDTVDRLGGTMEVARPSEEGDPAVSNYQAALTRATANVFEGVDARLKDALDGKSPRM